MKLFLLFKPKLQWFIWVGLCLLLAQAANAQISGTVFFDGNNDGIKQLTERTLANMTVNAVAPSGATLTDITDTNGNYTILGTTAGLSYRVELSVPFGYNDAAFGSNSGTSVQFAASNATALDFGINVPDKCSPDRTIRVVTGMGLTSVDDYTVKSWDYITDRRNVTAMGSAGTTTPHAKDLLDVEVGVPFGVAVQKRTDLLYFSTIAATLTNVFPAAPDGIDALYVAQYNGPGKTFTGYKFLTKLSSYGISVAALNPVDNETGEYGLGGVTISEDGNYLYVVNMGKGNIAKIDISGVTFGSIPVGGYTNLPVTEIGLTSTNCPNGIFRPSAIEYYAGRLYVVGICDASVSGSASSDLRLRGFEMNVATNTFSEVLDYDLSTFTGGGLRAVGWPQKKWSGTWLGTDSDGSVGEIQPIVPSLGFDDNGAMIIGITNRQVFVNGSSHRETGYMLRTWKETNGSFTVEFGGVSGPYTSTAKGSSTNSGAQPGYYDGSDDPSTAGPGNDWFFEVGRTTSHPYLYNGGILVVPGTNLVIGGFGDPGNPATQTGGRYLDYTTGISLYGTSLVGQKASVMGDLEAICGTPPIEIGNRVWFDTDSDGVQDGDESGISGVTVELYQGTTFLASAITNVDGHYIFSSDTKTSTASFIYGVTGLAQLTNYSVRIPNIQGAGKQGALGANVLTVANTSGTLNDETDKIDSDGLLQGNNAEVAFTTRAFGSNSHTLDFGFRAQPPCTLTVSTAVPTACVPATNTYNLAVTVSYSNPPTGDITINVGGTNYTFTPDGTSPDTYNVPGLTSNGTAGIDVSATFVGDAACTHTLADAYDAPASCACNTATTLIVGDLLAAGGGEIHTFIFDPVNPSMCSTAPLPGGEGMAVDYTNGIIYIVDATNSKILKYNIATETYSELLSTNPCWSYDMDLSADGQFLYVTCTSQIYKVNTSTGAVVASISETAFSGDYNLWGVAVHPLTGEVYVTRGFNGNSPLGNGSLSKIDANLTGPATTLTTVTDGSLLMGLEFSANGTLWVVRDGKGVVSDAVLNYSSDGTSLLATYPMTPDLTAGSEPTDIAFGPDGNMYVATWLNYCVVKYDYGTSNWSELIPASAGSNGKTLAFACGLVNCATCSLTITSATPTACDPATNTYSLDVAVTYTNPPAGDMTINVGGTNYTFTPNGSGGETFTVTGLVSNGTAGIDVSATFVGDAACTHTLVDAYNAPASCGSNFPEPYTCTSATLLVGDLFPSGSGQTVAFPFGTGAIEPPMCSTVLPFGGEGMQYCTTNNKVYISDADGSIVVWDVATNSQEASIPLGAGPFDAALSNDCSYLYVSMAAKVIAIDLSTNTIAYQRPLSDFTGGTGQLWGVDVNPITGQVYVTRGFSTFSSGTIYSLNPDLQGTITTVVAEETGGFFMGMEFLPNGDFWVVWDADSGNGEEIRLYSSSGVLLDTIPIIIGGIAIDDSSPNDIAFGPDGNIYVSTYTTYCVIRYVPTTDTWEVYLPLDPSGAQGKSLAFVCANMLCATCDLSLSNVQVGACNCTATEGYLDVSGLSNLLPDGITFGTSGTYSNVPLPGQGTVDITYTYTGTGNTLTPDFRELDVAQGFTISSDYTNLGFTGTTVPGLRDKIAAGATGTLTYNFDQPTSNINLIVFDVDWDDAVTVTAIDANGNVITDFSGWTFNTGDLTSPIDAAPAQWNAATAVISSTSNVNGERNFAMLTPDVALSQVVFSFTGTTDPNNNAPHTQYTIYSNLTGESCTATLTADVTWTNAPTGENIIVSAGAYTQTINVSGGVTSPQTISILVPTDGSTNMPITATFETTTTCTDAATYSLPNCPIVSCTLTATADGTNVLCNGGTDGTATATASGNIAAVTYAWSNGSTTATISNLAAGTYTVTVTETASCTAVASYTVTEPALLSLTCNKTDVTTNGGTDGTATVNPTGGTSPYTYLWSSGETTASISGKTSGTYTVTVTDTNGCTDLCNSTINEPGCNLSASADGTNVLCNGGTDGTAAATASGNIAAVTYLWSNGGTTATISNLAAGTYTVTVTESATCTAVTSYTVSEPALLSLTCNKTDVTTNGGSDGTATVSATGGTSPYTYLWSSGETTASISSKTAATYTVTVTDTNGCTDVCASSINEPGAVCSLTGTGFATVICNDNGTTADATDDYISFTLNPTGTTLGSGYVVTVSSGSITPNTGNYGAATVFQLQNGSAGSGNTVTLTITDNTDTNCMLQVNVADTGSCSTPTCPPMKCLPISVTKN